MVFHPACEKDKTFNVDIYCNNSYIDKLFIDCCGCEKINICKMSLIFHTDNLRKSRMMKPL